MMRLFAVASIAVCAVGGSASGAPADFSNNSPNLIDFVLDPQAVLRAPKFDVTALSRDNKVHISFCNS